MVMLSTGDTAWVLIASLLVLLMSIPGVAFFYSGLTKRKNVLNTMFLTFIAFSIASVIWVAYGYPFAFGDVSINGMISQPAHFFMSGIGINDLTGSIPTILFIVFQLTFAGLTAALVSGAIVGRMKTSAWMIFIIAWVSLVYIPIAHLGKRKNPSLLPHNLGYSVLGAGLLWFGWMGFNGGSALAANGLAASAILVSNVAAATALITWVLIDTVKVGKPTMLGAITGGVAGLVAITPAAGFVDVPAAIIIGFVTAFVSYYAINCICILLCYLLFEIKIRLRRCIGCIWSSWSLRCMGSNSYRYFRFTCYQWSSRTPIWKS